MTRRQIQVLLDTTAHGLVGEHWCTLLYVSSAGRAKVVVPTPEPRFVLVRLAELKDQRVVAKG